MTAWSRVQPKAQKPVFEVQTLTPFILNQVVSTGVFFQIPQCEDPQALVTIKWRLSW
jgi:Sec-independent protein secretion pathway component TatC